MLALAHVDRDLEQAQLRVGDADERLHLGRLAHVGVGEQAQRLWLTAYIPLVPSVIGCPSRSRMSSRSSDVPKTRSGAGRYRSPSWPESGRKRDPTATSHGVAHQREHPRQLGRGVLAVGVEPPAELVAALERLAVALGDPGSRSPRFSPNETTSAPPARAASAVPSFEPSSTTSRSTPGRTCAPPPARRAASSPRSRRDEDDGVEAHGDIIAGRPGPRRRRTRPGRRRVRYPPLGPTPASRPDWPALVVSAASPAGRPTT